MKLKRIVAAVIMLSALLVAGQNGQIQAYSTDLKAIYSFENHEISPQTSPLSGNLTFPPPVLKPKAQTGTCHFGITALGVAGYDLSILGVDSYLDWTHTAKNSSVANNIEFFRVLNVSDAEFQGIYNALPSLIDANPSGAIWVIGNEPDSQVIYQDHISAETYAYRYYQLAHLIRLKDPTAKITFGTVIQPTQVRLYYLSKAIEHLVQLEGDRANALGLIDIYSIHAFILNEQPLYDSSGHTISWGAGVPVGYDSSTWPAYEVIDGAQTHDINIFKSRLIAFRQWMKDIGEQSKPLWITEYGSLFPVWLNVSELETASFMEQTFDFMLETKNSDYGYPGDHNRLVQKWLWYSLNDNVDHFGGSLYNPQTHQLTIVGDHFIKYNPTTTIVPITNPDVFIDMSSPTITSSTAGNYKITIKVGNNTSSDRLTGVKVDLYLGNNLLGSVTANLPRCAGKLPFTFNVSGLLVGGENYAFRAHVSLLPENGIDLDPTNNEFLFSLITVPNFLYVMLPIVSR